MLGIIAALSPKLYNAPLRRETSTAPTTPTLLSSYWTGTSSSTFARKCNTSGESFRILPTTHITRGATGLSCTSWAARGQVPYQKSQSPSREMTHSSSKAIAKAFNRQFTACFVPQELRPNPKKDHEGNPLPPSRGPLNTRPFNMSIAAAIRKVGPFTDQGPDGLTALHNRHLEGAQLVPGNSPLPEWLQTEALNHLGPAPHSC